MDMDRISALRQDYQELLDAAAPLDGRIRCLYRLKDSEKTPYGAQILAEAVDTTDSVLLQHELVYNIGQFGFSESVPRLKEIVQKTSYDVVTRHEALEALGAIAEDAILPFLYEYAAEDGPAADCAPIRESAVLAICRIEMKQQEGNDALSIPKNCPFVSVDPSPAFSFGAGAAPLTLVELEQILMTGRLAGTSSGASSSVDADGSDAITQKQGTSSVLLWNRYRAMFTIRNIGGKDAAVLLGNALRKDRTSCLFRHEIAFVLGQMEHPASEPFLAEALADEQEHEMVRHEAAEAIGALAEKHSLEFLEKYAHHDQAIVRDSCAVALDMHRYWSQYKKAEEGSGDS